jgi:outer membrane protein
MIRLIQTAFLLIALFGARAAYAQDLRIAVVNLQRLTTGTEEGKKANEKLEKRFQEISAEMQKLSRTIEEKEAELKKQGLVLSATRRDQIAREIENDKINLSRKNEDYQRELAEMEQEVMGPVVDVADRILQAYVKEKNFTVLINLAVENSNVVWYNPANDITEDVIKLINAAKVTTVPAAATPPAKPAAPPAAPASQK